MLSSRARSTSLWWWTCGFCLESVPWLLKFSFLSHLGGILGLAGGLHGLGYFLVKTIKFWRELLSE